MSLKNQWQYECQLYHQIRFAQHSILKLGKCKDSFIDMAFYVQSLLTATGNIAKLLNNEKNISTKARSQDLQNLLCVDINNIPNILNKELRNTNEHIDERIDSVATNHFVGDMSFGGTYIPEEYTEGNWRYYDPERKIIIYADRNKKLHNVELRDLKKELLYLQKSKGMQYIWLRYEDSDKFYL